MKRDPNFAVWVCENVNCPAQNDAPPRILRQTRRAGYRWPRRHRRGQAGRARAGAAIRWISSTLSQESALATLNLGTDDEPRIFGEKNARKVIEAIERARDAAAGALAARAGHSRSGRGHRARSGEASRVARSGARFRAAARCAGAGPAARSRARRQSRARANRGRKEERARQMRAICFPLRWMARSAAPWLRTPKALTKPPRWQHGKKAKDAKHGTEPARERSRTPNSWRPPMPQAAACWTRASRRRRKRKAPPMPTP